MSSNILAVDVGYGDVKVISGNANGISRVYKFPTAVAPVKVNELLKDPRLIKLGDETFYVGEDALSLPLESQINIDNYPALEKYAPILIAKAMLNETVKPDMIVLGLSIAQAKNSGHYKKAVADYFKPLGIECKIKLLPQGAAAKKAIDKYGETFPEETTELLSSATYVGADIGFNTLDIFFVLNGKTSSALVKGIEGRGIIVIASRLINQIEKDYQIKLSLADVRKVIRSGELMRRGRRFDFSEMVKTEVAKYVKELKILIDQEFGDVLDRAQALFVFGGGAYDLTATKDPFVKTPVDKAEYYNAIGYFLEGVDELKGA